MSSRASSSRASYRSMEILSPEPPKELDIPLDSDSEAEKIEKSKQKDKRAKKVRKKAIPVTPEVNDEEIEKALKVIQDQDIALGDLRSKYESLKDETEKIRRENAAGFYRLKHLLGEKGNSLLDQIYFKDYPDLEKLDAPESEIVEIEDGQSEISEIPTEGSPLRPESTDFKSVFFQTEVEDEPSENPENSRPKSCSDIKSEISENAKSESSESFSKKKGQNFIQRNIELAKTGENLTESEKKRVEKILDENFLIDENYATEEETRLAIINTQLENKFSSKEIVPVESISNLDRLRDIDSQLAILSSGDALRANFENFQSSTLMLTDCPHSEISDENFKSDENSEIRNSKLVPSETISQILRSCLTDKNGSEESEPPTLDPETRKKLLEEAMVELDLI